MKIERILCPLQLANEPDGSLRYAVALARAYEASLVLFHVVRPENSQSDGNADLVRERLQQLKAKARKELDSKTLIAVDCDAVAVESDDVGAAIAEQAGKQRVDLIVMRSRRRPHRAALLGSTAESVCRTAPCSVLVVHSDERDWVNEATREIELKRVLVAYDFSDHSELALNHGLSLAQEYQGELHLLHVLPAFTVDEPEISWFPLGKEGVYHKAARRLQNVVPAEAHLWCQIKNAVSEGPPYAEILTYAEENQIDLICLGAHGAGFGMRTLFGSNVDRVLRQAPCPVLVARPLKHARTLGTKSALAALNGNRFNQNSDRSKSPAGVLCYSHLL